MNQEVRGDAQEAKEVAQGAKEVAQGAKEVAQGAKEVAQGAKEVAQAVLRFGQAAVGLSTGKSVDGARLPLPQGKGFFSAGRGPRERRSPAWRAGRWR
jgi:X-X-X-Leu-X-X-Gly heptad repeat protein